MHADQPHPFPCPRIGVLRARIPQNIDSCPVFVLDWVLCGPVTRKEPNPAQGVGGNRQNAGERASIRHTVQESSIIPANCFQRATFADGKRANSI